MNTAVSHSYEYGRTVCIRGHAIYEVFSRLLSALTQIRICTSMRPRILFVWDVGMEIWWNYRYILSKSTDRYSGTVLRYITRTAGQRIIGTSAGTCV